MSTHRETKHEERVDEDTESQYDNDIEDDVDVEEVNDTHDLEESKPEHIPEDNDNEDDEEDDDEDDPEKEYAAPKKRVHKYHQIPESTEIKIVHPSKRVTSEYMTLYEYSIVVGTRATHIANGSILYTDPQGLFDPRDIAKKEINENKCPLSITRKVSPTMIEVWEVNEMIKPQL